MKSLMPDTSGQIPTEVKLVFSLCDICEGEHSEDSEENEPLTLLYPRLSDLPQS